VSGAVFFLQALGKADVGVAHAVSFHGFRQPVYALKAAQ
jgi:hypothetical protein